MGFALFMLIALAALVVLLAGAMAWVIVHPPRWTLGVALARGNPTDPAEAGASRFETITVAAEDGAPIDVWLAEGGNANGPAVVLVHGWADSRFGLLLWYAAVGPAASRVAMYDLRGHGDAAHGRFEWGRCERDDLLRVIEAVAQRAPGAAIVVMGLSMGAMIAIDAAASEHAKAGRIAGVVADSPFVKPSEVVGRMCRSLGLPHWPMTPLALAALGLRWPGMMTYDTAARAAELRVPLLVLVGDRDRVSPPFDAKRVTEAAGPGASMCTFPGAGHLQAACANRETYTRALRQFFDGLAAGR